MSEHLFNPDDIDLPGEEKFRELYGLTPRAAIDTIDQLVDEYIEISAKLRDLKEQEAKHMIMHREAELAEIRPEIENLEHEKYFRLSPMIASLKHWISDTPAYERYLENK